jgi:23S rRNA (adenine2030-N6)-methyltransferase
LLSYRHAFHAGNHADVLKHLVLAESLAYLCAKDKPLWYIDTHAGAGRYALGSHEGRGEAEYRGGIARIWEQSALPPALARYRSLVARLNPGGKLRHYPGSPLLAGMLLRPSDRMWLHELHPSEVGPLERSVRDLAAPARVLEEDGLAGLKALLPPKPRRALVMIDPPYERKEEYGAVLGALADALTRFASGVYLLWYPLLAQTESRRLPERLMALGAERWLQVELHLREPAGPGSGLLGSGMHVINPPYTLAAELSSCRDTLCEALALPGVAAPRLDIRSA